DPPVVEFGPSGFPTLGTSLAALSGGVLAGAPDAESGGAVLRLDAIGVVHSTYRHDRPDSQGAYGPAGAANNHPVFVGVAFDNSGNGEAGAVFAYPVGLTSEDAVLRKRVVDAAFGTSVAADDSNITVGAPGDASGKGGVYAFPAQPTPCDNNDVCAAKEAFSG